MSTVSELAPVVGVVAACLVLCVSRATFYRRRRPGLQAVVTRPTPSRALSADERRHMLEVLHEPRFVDKAPAEVYGTLLDEKVYICSVSTMYRVLAANAEVRERRNQLRHPQYAKPELIATAPNQVWSWDITKLLGPVKWTYYYLYVLLDIFSRYVVGWMVATRESAALAKQLITESCEKQHIQPGQLTVHSDRGPSMTSKPVALLLADLGATKSVSRPHVSNDNPFSESQFKTLKYRPDFPDRFGSLEHARSFCQTLFPWYNTEHRHSGLALLTPEVVHYGRTVEVLAARRDVLERAYADHPERFVRRPPRPLEPPTAVWINPPAPDEIAKGGTGGHLVPLSMPTLDGNFAMLPDVILETYGRGDNLSPQSHSPSATSEDERH
jgi:putative transposase